MAKPTYFPRHIILAGAVLFGVLLALGIHIILQRFNLNLGDLWKSDVPELIPARAALAWWLIAAAAFVAGFVTASLLDSAASGQIPLRMRQFLIAVGVIMLAAAGQAASAPSAIPTLSGVLAGLVSLFLGAIMAFCGAHFALRRA
ncbi:MAG: hypothetical protein V4661_02730 [Pseudomonadota bacterium]